MTSATRETILRSIRTQGQCTVKELAEVVGISPVSVRHHLAQLQAEGLVATKEVRHGVGRPHHAFSLTDEAIELFPTRYFQLTNRLLDEIKYEMSPERVKSMFARMASSISEDFVGTHEHLPIEERLPKLMTMLSNEGFDAEYEIQGNQVIIRLLSCPYLQLVHHHPEVDFIDQELIAKTLSLPFERVNCLTEGDTHCSFVVHLPEGEQSE
ncbi:MAG: ArsR family transcriptional regulator [Anaerolineaceae bacterium]|nr:MAG: ArsR family transcriptional regulator [Anaerolineaceae bacterium]